LNAITIWIVLPLLAAIALFFIRHREKVMHLTGIAITLLLAWLAWQLPVGEPVSLRLWPGFPTFRIAEGLSFLGERLAIDNTIRPYVLMIYLMTGFWFGGAYAARVSRNFIPFGLSIAGIFAATISIQSSGYAPLLIGINALLAVPILTPPGKGSIRGVQRFIIFYIIGACLLLISEKWLLVSIAGSGNSQISKVASIPLLTGYTLLLAGFPFFSWIPMLAEESDPYSAGFVFLLFPTGISFLLLNNLDRYLMFGVPSVIFTLFLVIGMASIIAGGLWGTFEHQLGRLLGFTTLTQIGILMTIIGLGNEANQTINLSGLLFTQLAAMGIGMALWAESLSAVQSKVNNFMLDSLRGISYRLPAASFCLVLAQFSLFGLPLLASFPIYLILWTNLARISLMSVLALLLCSAGLMSASLRTIAVLLQEKDGVSLEINEDRFQLFLLVLGGLALLITGLKPSWLFLPLLQLGG